MIIPVKKSGKINEKNNRIIYNEESLFKISASLFFDIFTI
jgi:hypothetical protein